MKNIEQSHSTIESKVPTTSQIETENSLVPTSHSWINTLADIDRHGIEEAERRYQAAKQAKLLSAVGAPIQEMVEEAKQDSETIGKIKRVSEVLKAAEDADIEYDELAQIWSGLIKSVHEGDPEHKELLNATKSLSPSEAAFLLSSFQSITRCQLGLIPNSQPSAKKRAYIKEQVNSLEAKGLLFSHRPFRWIGKILLFSLVFMLFIFFMTAIEQFNGSRNYADLFITLLSNIWRKSPFDVIVSSLGFLLFFSASRTSVIALTVRGDKLCRYAKKVARANSKKSATRE